MKAWREKGEKRPHIELTHKELKKSMENETEFFKLQSRIAWRIFLIVPSKYNYRYYKVLRRCYKDAKTKND